MPLYQAGDLNVDQLLASISEKAPIWQARGGDIERAGRMPEDLLQWIYELRLFKLMLPQEFGGRPTPLPDMLRIFEELAAIDGSLGWLVHIGAAGGYFAPSFEKEVARELFSPREAVIAGSGFPAGRARRTAGGYTVSGRWRYASGAQYATLFTANAVCEDEGKQVIRAFAFFPDQIQIVHDWGSFGLKATASDSMVVDEAFVPSERVFVVGESKWQPADPVTAALFRLPFDIVAVTTIASVSIGLTRRFFELARDLHRWETLGHRQGLAREAAEYRELYYLLARRAWSWAEAGHEFPEREKQAIMQGIRRLVAASVRAVQEAFAYLGMRALWETEPINRVYRDLQAASHHVFLRPPEAGEDTAG